MKTVVIDAPRLAKLAAALREQIPNASPDVARPMIDAAAELQRMSDELTEYGRANAEELAQRLSQAAAECTCDTCRARRAAEGKLPPGSLN